MSDTIVEWAALLVLALLFAVSAVVEIKWLVSKGWATSSRAMGFVLTTDIVGFFVGGFVAFVVFGILLMMTFGPAGTGSTAPEIAYWLVSAIAIVVPPVLLFLIKRLCLLIFKIGSGGSAWLFSIVSAAAFVLIVIVPPPVLFYVAATLWK